MSPSSSKSPSASPSPSVPTPSPASQTALLSMAPAPELSSSTSNDSSSSTRGTPSRHPVDLPRTQIASKGGCWTCRLRRKKCDEQREGDSCRTCIRLTIECLGWGPKRPEWMRDKQAVEAYKANIKAQLTRAGLIRGQPRSSLLNAQAALSSSDTPPRPAPRRPPTTHRFSAPANSAPNSPPIGLGLDLGLGMNNILDRSTDFYQRHEGFLPGVTGASNPQFHQIPAASYSDPDVNNLDLNSSYFQYSPQPSTLSTLSTEPLDFDIASIAASSQHQNFDFDVRPPTPTSNFPIFSSQNSIQENHVMYYFENLRKVHFLFGGNTMTNVTYSLIVQEPRGAVTNAVCALASLHFTRMRVAQGLEAPDPNPEHSPARYFYDEAYFQLANARHVRGSYNESDVIAALHLVCFSQLSGGLTDWQPVLGIALDWMAQIGMSTDENPKGKLSAMPPAAQIAVKCTMWMDIFSSLTLMRPPKYHALYQRLLGQKIWPADGSVLQSSGLNIETLVGCPDDAMLAIAEVSALAHWKALEQRKGTLSYRELIRRGDAIEQRLRQPRPEPPSFEDETPLHPNLLQPSITDNGGISFASEEVRRLQRMIFRETAALYLHTVLNDSNPGVPDINSSVETIVQLIHQLPPSDVDRALVFPICLAGCLTDDSTRRDLLKGRLQAQDESIGNLMRTRLLMEAVWQKRDVNGGTVDWRETMRERSLNLLLV